MFTPNCENMLAIRLYHRRDHFRRRQCDLWGDGWGGGGGGGGREGGGGTLNRRKEWGTGPRQEQLTNEGYKSLGNCL